jgi:hypothetical protein
MDYGARFYSPILGRFISADSVVPQPRNPQSLNRYSYVINNPLAFTDPNGHCYDTVCNNSYSTHIDYNISGPITLYSQWALYGSKGETPYDQYGRLTKDAVVKQNSYNGIIWDAVSSEKAFYMNLGITKLIDLARLVKRQVARESHFDVNAGIGTDYVGLMQISMGALADVDRVGINRQDGAQNIAAGVAYLGYIYEKRTLENEEGRPSDQTERWRFTMAMYNAGINAGFMSARLSGSDGQLKSWKDVTASLDVNSSGLNLKPEAYEQVKKYISDILAHGKPIPLPKEK